MASPTAVIRQSGLLCLQRWLKIAEIEDSVEPGETQADAVELREANKGIRLLEQENEFVGTNRQR